ncbi:hypothetical protein V6N13_059906 [Hibiscus sabdariffa]|uniref:Uncharacterized protein n=1 Tax=Hibiscus sabdariffa TaxID=183260 RepID=A0ABR2GCG6_9ROSI
MGPFQNEQNSNPKAAPEEYVDIPITFESESPRTSSRSSEPIAPILEKDTKLFRIRPKYLRISRLLSFNSISPKFNKTHLWTSLKQDPSKQKSESYKGRSLIIEVPHKQQVDDRNDSCPDKIIEEAVAILDTSSKLEICFKCGKEAISEKTQEMKNFV